MRAQPRPPDPRHTHTHTPPPVSGPGVSGPAHLMRSVRVPLATVASAMLEYKPEQVEISTQVIR